MDDTEICSVFPEFKELDDLLRCGICYETLTTPVIISCSHTFCSICIRKWLSTKQECPSCSETVYETSVRKNPIVANLVEAVKTLKKKISGKNKTYPSSSSENKILSSPSNSRDEDGNGRKLKLNSPSSSSRDKTVLNSPRNSRTEDCNDFKPKLFILKTPPPIQNEDDYDFKPNSSVRKSPPSTSTGKHSVTPQPVSKKTPAVKKLPTPIRVACPICDSEMPERLVFDHLDRCSGVSTRPSVSKIPSSSKSAQTSSPGYSSTVNKNVQKSSILVENNQTLEPIKKMVYNLLSDKQLRTELKKYGLAAQGDRRTILSRLQRYVIMHNAECDSNNPRPLNIIKQQLEKEEKAMSSASNSTSFSQIFKKTNNPDEIANVNREYIRQNNSSYQSLIQQIKVRGKDKKMQNIDTINLSDQEDNPPVFVPKTTPCASSARNDNADSDSDSVSENLVKTPCNRRNVSKNVKRKVQCIESESEDEFESGRHARLDKKVKEATSPVLTRTVSKTPVRRELRSRVSQNKDSSGKDEPPQPPTRNQRKSKSDPDKKKQLPKQTKKGAGKSKEIIASVGPHPPALDVSNDNDRAEERLLSPTPDLFGSPPSPASSEVTCGQKPRQEGRGDDALHDLVSLLEESSSSTDFDD